MFIIDPYRYVSGPPAAVTTWNPADKATDVVLSNGNLTMTGGAGGGTVRGTTSKSTGKWHFEITLDAILLADPNYGVMAADVSLTLGNPIQSSGANVSGVAATSGWAYVRGAFQGTVAPGSTGLVVAVELDLDNNLIFFQANGGSRSTGYNISAVAKPLFPFAYSTGGTPQATLNCGQSAFVVTPTSGFSAWG